MARRDPVETARQAAEVARLRLQAYRDKRTLQTLRRAYDAARPSQYHPKRGDKRSADAVMTHAGTRLRELARYLDENSDIAIAVLDDLTNKAIGTGIGIEPMIKDARGRLALRVNAQVRELWGAWTADTVDARRELPWGDLQRLVFRTTLRDGEMLTRHVEGAGAIRHRGPIPYSLELLEADHLPFDLFDRAETGNRTIHGVELNAWGEAVAYHLTDHHPGDLHLGTTTFRSTTRRVPAQAITHLKFSRRLGQTRGVTVLHGALNRLQDVKDYDESELIAARVASAFTVAITRSEGFQGSVSVDEGRRQYELAPGLIIDDLLPGESVETISSNRPNSAYDNFRGAQVRGVAGATGTAYSSVARRYDGNYSAQRQELVESQIAYQVLRRYFVARWLREVYRRFVDLSIAAGALDTRGANLATLYQFQAIEPATPWIDPEREGKADELLLRNRIASRHQIIRRRGGDPAEVDAQIEADPMRVDDHQGEDTGDAPGPRLEVIEGGAA